MPSPYLKHVPSGQIFVYQTVFAIQEDFVEVADAQGSPVVPDAVEDDTPVAKPRAKAKKAGIAVPSDDLDLDLDAALSADASRGA